MQVLEESIIGQIIRASRSVGEGRLRLGIGDDTAVLRSPKRGREILLTTDQIIENTHFIRADHPAKALGYKTLARGVSDIAAMGGGVECFLLSLCLPEWAHGSWLKQYIYGVFQAARTFDAPCAGGDIARGKHFSAGITVVGSVPEGKALRRDTARDGDRLFVSGKLGGSALGLLGLPAGLVRGAAARRHLYPEPRLALGEFLLAKLPASAAMDLSDGLSMDVSRLARASNVGVEIDVAAIPIFPGATLEQALHGGEEYELLFAARPRARVPEKFEGVPLTCIGKFRSRRGVVLRTGSRVEALKPTGFQHFK